MIILEKKTPAKAKEIVALFGSGLIGSYIIKNILKLGGYSSAYFPFDWENIEQCRHDADTIYSFISF